MGLLKNNSWATEPFALHLHCNGQGNMSTPSANLQLARRKVDASINRMVNLPTLYEVTWLYWAKKVPFDGQLALLDRNCTFTQMALCTVETLYSGRNFLSDAPFTNLVSPVRGQSSQ